MNKTVIIQGSSRSNGDTYLVVDYIASTYSFDTIDLKKLHIGHFDYEFKNNSDDFLPTIKHIIKSYDTIIFATPVYWYSMSGILKVFFDRISDLLINHKPLGRQLRGKQTALISCSNANDLIEGFDIPFKASAQYLGMKYIGTIHTWIEKKVINPKATLQIHDFFDNWSTSKA